MIHIANPYKNKKIKIEEVRRWTRAEFREIVSHMVLHGDLEPNVDANGQLIFETKFYLNDLI